MALSSDCIWPTSRFRSAVRRASASVERLPLSPLIARSLPPVQLCELVGDIADRQDQHAIGTIAPFDREFDECDQQGVFVRRDERAFREDAFDVGDEPDLILR
jgi:hypothetical protein